jgi:NodT family efflux transporter outer membrane factor (OMF) lipoprotein
MRAELALAAAVLLAGCAGTRPTTPQEARVGAPLAWRTSVDAGGELSARWWDSFGDPGLTAVVESALAHNEDIRIAAARIEELASQAALAHARRMPEVEGSVTRQRDRSVNPAYGTPDVENLTESVVGFSYDADLFGRLRAADAASRADLLATRAAHDDIRLAVAALAARSWFNLRSLDERLDVLRQTVVVREQTLQLVRRRVSVGYATQLDLAQADAEYRATQQLVPVTELSISRTEDALSVLLGQSPREIERSVATPTLPSIPAALPSSLLRRRPDIVEAEELLVAADRRLDASRAAFMPDLRLQGDWGHVNSTIIPRPLDVFTIGAGLFAAAARRDEAAWTYRKTALKAFAEVDDALAATQRLREQLDALESQRVALDRTLKIASRRYKAGYAPFLDQLDAQRGLLSVQLAASQVRAEQRSAFVMLFQALGGGWNATELMAANAREGANPADQR